MPLRRSLHFEAQAYHREVGRGVSLGVFPYHPDDVASQEQAAAAAATATDRATVKYYECLQQDKEYIKTKLNVRPWHLH